MRPDLVKDDFVRNKLKAGPAILSSFFWGGAGAAVATLFGTGEGIGGKTTLVPQKKGNTQDVKLPHGCGSKLNRRGYAGFGLCFHLPGFHFGAGFLSHSHMCAPFRRSFIRGAHFPELSPLGLRAGWSRIEARNGPGIAMS